MSQANVQKVIARLLSDEELRIRFATAPWDAIADLHERGMALTPDEIDVFVRSDIRVWFGETQRVPRCVH